MFLGDSPEGREECVAQHGSHDDGFCLGLAIDPNGSSVLDALGLPRGTIALCYGAGDWDRTRSVPPKLFAPLCQHARCITLMPEPTSLDVLNPDGCPLDIGTGRSNGR